MNLIQSWHKWRQFLVKPCGCQAGSTTAVINQGSKAEEQRLLLEFLVLLAFFYIPFWLQFCPAAPSSFLFPMWLSCACTNWTEWVAQRAPPLAPICWPACNCCATCVLALWAGVEDYYFVVLKHSKPMLGGHLKQQKGIWKVLDILSTSKWNNFWSSHFVSFKQERRAACLRYFFMVS